MTLAWFCPNVGECLRVCFSLISVVLVVVYQPGKWLWWCQLTPHCHSRFVSQTPHLSPTRSSLTLPHLLPPTHSSLLPSLPVTFFLILWCFQFNSSVLLLFLFDSISISMMMTNTLLGFSCCNMCLKLSFCTRSVNQFLTEHRRHRSLEILSLIKRIYNHVNDFKMQCFLSGGSYKLSYKLYFLQLRKSWTPSQIQYAYKIISAPLHKKIKKT